MNTFMLSNCVVCGGFGSEPAIRFSKTSSDTDMARFKVGECVYDSKAENKKRYNNWSCICYGDVAKRIKNMGLQARSRINLKGSMDIYSYTDENGIKHDTATVIVDDIEYASPMVKKEETEKEPTSKSQPVEKTETTSSSDEKVLNLDEENLFFKGSFLAIPQ